MPGVRDELGAHMSIAGGLHRALERGDAVGCGAVQLFLKNQRQWAATPLAPDAIRAFHATRRRTGLRRVFAHATYLINLCQPDPALRRQAIAAFRDELERAEALGLSCVVIHPGSHLGRGLQTGMACVTGALDEILRSTAGYRVKVALENTAGGGHTVGRTPGELGALIRRSARPERLGICLDTCHFFAAGYDVRAPQVWSAVIDEVAEQVGLGRVLAFHLNDAAAGLGSGLDRHQHIGRGRLGLEPFRRLLNDRRFARVPKVLETPKEPEPEMDLANLARLRGLRGRVSASVSRRPAGTGR